MKLTLSIIIGLTGIALASVVYVKASLSLPKASIALKPDGVASLRSNNTEILNNGVFQVNQVVLKKASGETYFGDKTGTVQTDPARQQVVETFPWGQVTVAYSAAQNRIGIAVTTINTSSSDTIQSVWYQLLALKFPTKLKEYDGTIPLIVNNVGEPGIFKVSYESGSVAMVVDDVEKPLMLGFPWASDRPASLIYPLCVNTGRVTQYPDSYPVIKRPISPNSTDEFHVSLRFGRSDTAESELAGDIYKRFAQAFPPQLKWPDRRPIGSIFLANASAASSTNPRGWFTDPNVNFVTADGLADFKTRILALADASIAVMKDMNAQGAITWDLEGQQYGHLADPRVIGELAPEMASVVDEYFNKFRNAGLRVGMCIRPQQLHISPDRKTVSQTFVDDPSALLIEKIGYAKKRWGATLIYLDSNINSADSNPIDAAVLQRVSAAFPDVLIVPEHANFRYYAYSAPYKELRHGYLGTPDSVRSTYPNAFSLICTVDGPIDLYRSTLTAEVKNGDSIMYRTWFQDPQNQKVKAILKR